MAKHRVTFTVSDTHVEMRDAATGELRARVLRRKLTDEHTGEVLDPGDPAVLRDHAKLKRWTELRLALGGELLD